VEWATIALPQHLTSLCVETFADETDASISNVIITIRGLCSLEQLSLSGQFLPPTSTPALQPVSLLRLKIMLVSAPGMAPAHFLNAFNVPASAIIELWLQPPEDILTLQLADAICSKLITSACHEEQHIDKLSVGTSWLTLTKRISQYTTARKAPYIQVALPESESRNHAPELIGRFFPEARRARPCSHAAQQV